MKLCELSSGNSCLIVNIYAEPKLKRRLYELGFLPNSTIELLNVSPMSRAYLIRINNSIFAIRKDIANKIQVKEISYNDITNILNC